MDGQRANLNPAVLFPDPDQIGNAPDVDQYLRLAEPQLHQWNQAVSAGQQLAAAVGRRQFGKRIIQRCRPVVIEWGGNHACPPGPELRRVACSWMMRHSFSGRSIMSMCFMPSASDAAATIAGVEPSVPASPTPLAPSGLTGVGVTVECSSKCGKSIALGSA